MAARNDSNELLKFMTNATSSIQEAMGRSAKTKKVNHRKYLEKRLQKGPKKTKKPKTVNNVISLYNNRQPIATLLSKNSQSQTYFEAPENEYDQLFKLVSPPSISPATTKASTNCSAYVPPHNDYQQQQEIETILSEFEADSPLQSLYGDSNSARGSIESGMCSSSSFSMENALVSFNDGYVYSPSDISDFDESNYSSPRNPSPVYHHVSPSPPEMYYQQHHLSATYDCIPTTGSSLASINQDRPSGLSLLSYETSITDLLELVSTP